MNASQIYILIAVIVLVVNWLFLRKIKKKEQKKLSVLSAFGFSFIIAGIVFGENRLLGYGLMGTGVILAVIDIFKKLKSENQN